MKLIRTLRELDTERTAVRSAGKTLGFVPTMGALHKGHQTLVQQAAAANDMVIASVFVNPAQFNDKKDLEKYPRTPESDAEMLEKAGCHFAFFPEVNEMIPDEAYPSMDFGPLESVMEGAYRPGHFKGMAMIVSRFFELIQPTRAYFGEKDFQQLAIVREMAGRKFRDIEIVGCPTVREADGLALSSRNALLTPEQRMEAPVIYRSLLEAAEMIRETTIHEAAEMVKASVEQNGILTLQYIEFVDSVTLQPIQAWDPYKPQRACIAVFAGTTRLIDNIAL